MGEGVFIRAQKNVRNTGVYSLVAYVKMFCITVRTKKQKLNRAEHSQL